MANEPLEWVCECGALWAWTVVVCAYCPCERPNTRSRTRSQPRRSELEADVERAKQLQKGAEAQAAHFLAQRLRLFGLLTRLREFASDEWDSAGRLPGLLREIEAEMGPE